MIEKWVNFKRDYLEISFLRENWVCATSPYHRVCLDAPGAPGQLGASLCASTGKGQFEERTPGRPVAR